MTCDRINLFSVEIISDRWESPAKGEVIHAIQLQPTMYLAVSEGRHFFVPAADVRIVETLYPPATSMQLIEGELGKVK